MKVSLYGPLRYGFCGADVRVGDVFAWVQWNWPAPFEVGLRVMVVDEHRAFRPYIWIDLGWLGAGAGWCRW